VTVISNRQYSAWCIVTVNCLATKEQENVWFTLAVLFITVITTVIIMVTNISVRSAQAVCALELAFYACMVLTSSLIGMIEAVIKSITALVHINTANVAIGCCTLELLSGATWDQNIIQLHSGSLYASAYSMNAHPSCPKITRYFR